MRLLLLLLPFTYRPPRSPFRSAFVSFPPQQQYQLWNVLCQPFLFAFLWDFRWSTTSKPASVFTATFTLPLFGAVNKCKYEYLDQKSVSQLRYKTQYRDTNLRSVARARLPVTVAEIQTTNSVHCCPLPVVPRDIFALLELGLYKLWAPVSRNLVAPLDLTQSIHTCLSILGIYADIQWLADSLPFRSQRRTRPESIFGASAITRPPSRASQSTKCNTKALCRWLRGIMDSKGGKGLSGVTSADGPHRNNTGEVGDTRSQTSIDLQNQTISSLDSSPRKHERIRSNLRERRHVSEPPVTKSTLSELDVNKIVNNPKLRHDINFDPDLHFRPNLDGEKGRRKAEKASEFWETMRNQLRDYLTHREEFERLNVGVEWALPTTLRAIRGILETLVPQRDRPSVEETFNVELLMQQFRKGVADMTKLANWLSQLLKCHCAPMRDDWVDEMVTQFSNGDKTGDVAMLALGMKNLLGVLEAMKLVGHQAFWLLLED